MNAPDTWVYIIKDLDSKLYKIGRANDPLGRLADLSRQKTLLPKPHNFHLYQAWKTQCKDERFLHKYFRYYHRRGEWFALKPSTLNLIAEYFWEREKFFAAPVRELVYA